MEQVVWLYIGVIAALFGLVVIATIFVSGQNQLNTQELSNALQKLKAKESIVCKSEVGTMLSEKINLLSGSVLEVKDDPNSACVAYDGDKECVMFECPQKDYLLDLNKDGIKKLYTIHEFNCYIEKTSGGIEIECTG